MIRKPDEPRPPQMGAFSIDFHQDGDSCDSADQMLTVKIEDAGGGHYFVLTANRWAVNSPEEIADLLCKVQRMLRLAGWWTETDNPS